MTVGEIYVAKATGKEIMITDINEKTKTLIYKKSDGKSASMTSSTLHKAYTLKGVPEDTVEQTVEEQTVTEQPEVEQVEEQQSNEPKKSKKSNKKPVTINIAKAAKEADKRAESRKEAIHKAKEEKDKVFEDYIGWGKATFGEDMKIRKGKYCVSCGKKPAKVEVWYIPCENGSRVFMTPELLADKAVAEFLEKKGGNIIENENFNLTRYTSVGMSDTYNFMQIAYAGIKKLLEKENKKNGKN